MMAKRKRTSSSAAAAGKAKVKNNMHNSTNINTSNSSNNNNNNDEEPWSKSKKKRMRRLMAREKKNSLLQSTSADADADAGPSSSSSLSTTSTSTTRNQEQSQSQSQESQLLVALNKKPTSSMSALQQKFLSRLAGSRFRELNEELYTTNSSSALRRFQENPQLFEQYHEGFRTQVKSWPVNPIDVVYKWIISLYYKGEFSVDRGNKDDCDGDGKNEKKSNKKTKKNDNNNNALIRIADFGCGDAKLAEKLLQFRPNSNKQSKQSSKQSKKRKSGGDGNRDNAKNTTNTTNTTTCITKCPFKVHSFDLVANGNKLITPCDMSNVPLKNSSVDVGVFVLALMGTNIADFIREAHRVLTPSGILKIAEVRSRFESTVDGSTGTSNMSTTSTTRNTKQKRYNVEKQVDDTILNDFLDVMEELGFQCVKKDRQNKMFIVLEFKKTGKKPSKEASFTAKPCIYKRR